MDALRHPDLVALGHRLRRSFDRAAAAELEVARIAHARTRTLRDLLVEWEDAGHRIGVSTRSADHESGAIDAVGTDHLALRVGNRIVVLPLHAITSIEFEA